MGKRKVAIIGYACLPIGKFFGAYKDLSAVDLAATAIKVAVSKLPVGLAQEIELVFLGQVLPAGDGQAVGKTAAIKAGLGPYVRDLMFDGVCASALEAMYFAWREIEEGRAKVAIVGGVENMTAASKIGVFPQMSELLESFKDREGKINHMLYDGLWNNTDPNSDDHCHMGHLGERCAEKFGITKEDQDTYARLSYQRAFYAQESGLLKETIAPVTLSDGRVVESDEELDRYQGTTIAERLNALDEQIKKSPTVFKENGTITPVNAPGLNDGAAVLVLADEELARERGCKILGRIRHYVYMPVEPEWFTIAPALAVEQLVCEAVRLGIINSPKDLVYELNEAFAPVVIHSQRRLVENGWIENDFSRINIWGGAIARGHFIGGSSARIVGDLTYIMKHVGARFGVASACRGGGGAPAILIEAADESENKSVESDDSFLSEVGPPPSP